MSRNKPVKSLKKLEPELYEIDLAERPRGFLGKLGGFGRYITAPLIPFAFASMISPDSAMAKKPKRITNIHMGKDIELSISGPGEVKKDEFVDYTVIVHSDEKINYSVAVIGGEDNFGFSKEVRVYLGDGNTWKENKSIPFFSGSLSLLDKGLYGDFAALLSAVTKGLTLVDIRSKAPKWVDSDDYDGTVAYYFKPETGIVLLPDHHRYVFSVRAKEDGKLKVCVIYTPFSPLYTEARVIEGDFDVDVIDLGLQLGEAIKSRVKEIRKLKLSGRLSGVEKKVLSHYTERLPDPIRFSGNAEDYANLMQGYILRGSRLISDKQKRSIGEGREGVKKCFPFLSLTDVPKIGYGDVGYRTEEYISLAADILFSKFLSETPDEKMVIEVANSYLDFIKKPGSNRYFRLLLDKNIYKYFISNYPETEVGLEAYLDLVDITGMGWSGSGGFFLKEDSEMYKELKELSKEVKEYHEFTDPSDRWFTE